MPAMHILALGGRRILCYFRKSGYAGHAQGVGAANMGVCLWGRTVMCRYMRRYMYMYRAMYTARDPRPDPRVLHRCTQAHSTHYCTDAHKHVT